MPSVLVLVPLFFGTYLAGLAIYRLFFSPLGRAKIPGPQFGRLTKFYEAYYDIARNGKLAFKLDDLHDRYGPIVQLTPGEVHVKDSAFWDDLFVKHPRANRYASTASRFGNNDSMFAVADAGYHRMLRAPLNPFFSRRAILDQQALVQDKISILINGMTKLEESGTVFRITNAFAAFAGDVISQYSFGFSYGQVERYETGWKENFHDAYVSLGKFGHIAVQYPWVNPLLKAVPESMTLKMDPSLGQMLQLQKDFIKTIERIKRERTNPYEKRSSATIFDKILDSDLPAYAKNTIRLEHEAQTVIGGGIVTIAWTATHATFWILRNPVVHARLSSELCKAAPDISAADAFAYDKIERLPYLSGCVKEGVRMGVGLSGRNTRVLQEPLVYKGYTIPAGTAIGVSPRDLNFDPEIFEDAKQFKPERWIGVDGPPKAPDGSSLESWFMAFGKGSRSCIGVNLAYMELYLLLAHIFRRLKLELYETDESDIELAHDFFLPSPRLDSKGVRVRVAGLES